MPKVSEYSVLVLKYMSMTVPVCLLQACLWKEWFLFLDDPTFSACPAHKIAERLSSWMPEHLEAVYALCYANDEWRGWKAGRQLTTGCVVDPGLPGQLAASSSLSSFSLHSSYAFPI